MDRAPKQAPFPVGTRLRYVGETRVWYEEDGQTIPLKEPGLVVTICDTNPGRRGTLRPLPDGDGGIMEDESGEAILDRTRDGYSIYSVRAQGGRPRRQIVLAGEWEVLEMAHA